MIAHCRKCGAFSEPGENDTCGAGRIVPGVGIPVCNGSLEHGTLEGRHGPGPDGGYLEGGATFHAFTWPRLCAYPTATDVEIWIGQCVRATRQMSLMQRLEGAELYQADRAVALHVVSDDRPEELLAIAREAENAAS